MSIKKVHGRWKVDIRPNGAAGPRFRKSFTEKAEANRYAAYITEKHRQDPDWKPQKADNRRLSDIFTQWYELHGSKLNDGPGRLQMLDALARALGNPVARTMDPADFIRYGNQRMTARDDGTRPVTPSTVNRELTYTKAAFNKLAELKKWPHPNPLANVPPWKTPDQELTFLTLEQIDALLTACHAGRNPDTALCAELALDTGARWGEAERIKLTAVGSLRVTYYNTKGGRPRTVPITADLEKRLRERAAENGRSDGRVFGPCYQAFERALKRAKIKLPAGQRTHVLRHTFASHFAMNGGNLIVLQRTLGHADISTTMRYAHLAPDYMNTVTELRPLAKKS